MPKNEQDTTALPQDAVLDWAVEPTGGPGEFGLVPVPTEPYQCAPEVPMQT